MCDTGTVSYAQRPAGGVTWWKCSTCGATLCEHDGEDMADAPSDGDRDAVAALTLGGRVRAFRIEAGMNVMQVAAQVGVPWPAIHAIEYGRVSPRLRTLARMAKALGRDPGELVAGMDAGEADRPTIDLRSPH